MGEEKYFVFEDDPETGRFIHVFDFRYQVEDLVKRKGPRWIQRVIRGQEIAPASFDHHIIDGSGFGSGVGIEGVL